MKLLLENWRRYLKEAEEVASFASGDMFGDFMKNNPELTLKVFQKMGAGKDMLNIIQRYIREGTGYQQGNQMVAVLAGKKPMFYSNPVRWVEPNMDCLKRTAGPPEPTEVLEEGPDECPDIDIGNFIKDNTTIWTFDAHPLLGFVTFNPSLLAQAQAHAEYCPGSRYRHRSGCNSCKCGPHRCK